MAKLSMNILSIFPPILHGCAMNLKPAGIAYKAWRVPESQPRAMSGSMSLRSKTLFVPTNRIHLTGMFLKWRIPKSKIDHVWQGKPLPNSSPILWNTCKLAGDGGVECRTWPSQITKFTSWQETKADLQVALHVGAVLRTLGSCDWSGWMGQWSVTSMLASSLSFIMYIYIYIIIYYIYIIIHNHPPKKHLKCGFLHE